jgi:hypothetical protein
MFVANDVTSARAIRSTRSISTGCGIGPSAARATHGPIASRTTRSTGTSRADETAARSNETSSLTIAARTRIRIDNALADHANLSFWTNRARTSVLTGAIRIAILADIACFSNTRIDETAAIRLTCLPGNATHARAVVRTNAIDTNLSGVARNRAARIHARADATNLAVGTNETIARPHAIAFFALLPRGTYDGNAHRVDAKTIRIAHFVP